VGELTTTHKIGIYAEGSALRITPGQREVEQGDEIVFHNFHKGPVIVMLPDTELLGKTEMITLWDKGSQSPPLTVTGTAIGPYPYAAYDPVAKEFAHASVPIIIVYPKAK